MTSPNDVRCAAILAGDIPRATRYDAARMWRWIVALLEDDQDAAQQVLQQIGDCPGCLRGVIGGLAGLVSGGMLDVNGRDAAIQAARHVLVEVLSLDNIKTEPPSEQPPSR